MLNRIKTVVFLFHLVKSSYKLRQLLPDQQIASFKALKKSSNLAVLALTLNFLLKVFRKCKISFEYDDV